MRNFVYLSNECYFEYTSNMMLSIDMFEYIFSGEKPSLSQFQSGFSSNPEVTHTAFKPVPKR